VLSVSEYLSSKKPTLKTNQQTENTLTEEEVEQIKAQFNANLEKIPTTAPSAALDVNKRSSQSDRFPTHRQELVTKDHRAKVSTQYGASKQSSFWDTDDDNSDTNDGTSDQSPLFNDTSASLESKKKINDTKTSSNKSTSQRVNHRVDD
jgi:hypothetical protein